MFENILFSNLIHSEEFCRTVLPFLKQAYFKENIHRWTYILINEYVNKYNKPPNVESLIVDLNSRSDISEGDFRNTIEYIQKYIKEDKQDIQWLIDKTEKFCQDKAIENALYQSIEIVGDKTGKKPRTAIPDILQEALSVCFDTHIGHDYSEDKEKQFAYYHDDVPRVRFGLEYFDRITRGGLKPKTLNVFMGPVGGGKTLLMISCAAKQYMMGKKVLYITLEMSENEITMRTDANLMDVEVEYLEKMSKLDYDRKHEWIRSKIPGKLIVHEYPTAAAGASNFRHLLHELKIKKNFIPDVLYIDYLNICSSSRVKRGNLGLYEYVMTIAQEIRGLGVEHNFPIVSATQINRGGFNSSDPEMDDISDSWGGPMTFDLLLAMVSSESLIANGKIQIKQLKNRYSDYLKDNKFMIGCCREKMQIFDTEASVQREVIQGYIPNPKLSKFSTAT